MGVKKESAEFLNECCRRSLTNSHCLEVRNRYPSTKVASTQTPQLNSYMKVELSATTKSVDRESARMQTFMLDAMAPLSAILDADSNGNPLSYEDTLTVVESALQLIGNASSKMSLLRRSKITGQLNKGLLPLAKDETVTKFAEAEPMLFGTEFAKSSKEYVDQVKAMRTTLSSSNNNNPSSNRSGNINKPYFRGGPSGRRGAYNYQRGGATSNQFNWGGFRKTPYYPQNQNTSYRKEFKTPYQNRGTGEQGKELENYTPFNSLTPVDVIRRVGVIARNARSRLRTQI